MSERKKINDASDHGKVILLFILLSAFIIVAGYYVVSNVVYHETAFDMEDNTTLPYVAGQIVDDQGAQVRYLGEGEEGFMAYGPYMYLPPGNYQITFTLKPSSELNESACYLQVLSLETSNVTPIAMKTLASEDLKKNVYNNVTLNFTSKGQDDFEFRVYKYNNSELWLSNISLKPIAARSMTGLFNANNILFIILFIFFILIILAGLIALKMGYLDIFRKIPLWLILLVAVLVVYAGMTGLSSYGILPHIIMVGDEPHYLIMTQSIVEDHDFVVQNNYENKHYLSFFPHDLSANIGQQVVKDRWNEMVSIHGIGLPLLISVPFILGGVGGVRIFIAVVAAITSLLMFSALNKLGFSPKVSFITTLALSMVSPLIFYSFSIYPDTIALAITLVAINVFADVQNGKTLPAWYLFVSGLALAFLPWLGVKFGLISGMFMIAFVYSYLARKIPAVSLLIIVIPVLASIVLFEGLLYYQFNSLNPIMVYSGLDENYGPNQIDYAGNATGSQLAGIWSRISSMFSVSPIQILNSLFCRFVDVKNGMIIFAPFYILALIGLAVFIAGSRLAVNKKTVLIISLALLPYLAMYVMTMSVGGANPPGRTLLPLIGPIAMFTALGLDHTIKKGYIGSSIVYAALSLAVAVYMLLDPAILYTHDLIAELSPLTLDLSMLFPTFHIVNILDIYPYIVVALWACIVLWLLLFERFGRYAADVLRKKRRNGSDTKK